MFSIKIDITSQHAIIGRLYKAGGPQSVAPPNLTYEVVRLVLLAPFRRFGSIDKIEPKDIGVIYKEVGGIGVEYVMALSIPDDGAEGDKGYGTGWADKRRPTSMSARNYRTMERV